MDRLRLRLELTIFVAQKWRYYQPLLAFLFVLAAAQWLQYCIAVYILEPIYANPNTTIPWEGWNRAAGHLYDAVWLASSAALVGVSLVVFGGRKPWLAVWGWLCAVAVFVVAHPRSGDGSLPRFRMGAELVATLGAAGIFAVWFATSKTRANPAQVLMGVILAAMLSTSVASVWIQPSKPLYWMAVGVVAALVCLGVIIGMLWQHQQDHEQQKLVQEETNGFARAAQTAARRADENTLRIEERTLLAQRAAERAESNAYGAKVNSAEARRQAMRAVNSIEGNPAHVHINVYEGESGRVVAEEDYERDPPSSKKPKMH